MIEMRCKRHLSHMYIYIYIMYIFYMCIYTYLYINIYIYVYIYVLCTYLILDGFLSYMILVYFSDIVRGHNMFGGLNLF